MSNDVKAEAIYWLDSMGVGSDWSSIKDLSTDVQSVRCISFGYVIFEDDEKVVLVPHYSPGNSYVDPQGCGEMTIPVKSIVDRYPLIKDKSGTSVLDDNRRTVKQIAEIIYKVGHNDLPLVPAVEALMDELVGLRNTVANFQGLLKNADVGTEQIKQFAHTLPKEHENGTSALSPRQNDDESIRSGDPDRTDDPRRENARPPFQVDLGRVPGNHQGPGGSGEDGGR